MTLRFTPFALVAAFAALAFTAGAAEMKEDASLRAAIADTSRNAENRPRDVYRRPYEALTFWGLKPGMSVVELGPGSGYWTEILAPYAKANGGHYIAQMPDENDPKIPEQGKK